MCFINVKLFLEGIACQEDLLRMYLEPKNWENLETLNPLLTQGHMQWGCGQ